VDGVFTPALPGNLLAAGAFDTTLKLMLGNNHNEAGDVVEHGATINSEYFDRMLDYFMPVAKPSIREHIKSRYAPPEPPLLGKNLQYGERYETYSMNAPYYSTWPSLVNSFLNDAVYSCHTNNLARAFKNQTYCYLFSVTPGTHGTDTPYVFFNGPSPAVQNETLAGMFQSYLTNFVSRGNPNAFGLPDMPLYGKENVVTNINITTIETIKDPAAKEACYWWQKGLAF
jgi:carboxylesterase type B